MTLRPVVRWLFGGAFVVFVLNKLVLRPWVRAEAPALRVLTDTLPNACEGVMGALLAAGVGAWLRRRTGARLSDAALFSVTTLLAGVYVVTQEVGLHALGGANVTDPGDVVASAVGLGVALGVLLRGGIEA